MQFTFYGDLLGISSAYKLGPKTAYDKLNAFYEETFRTLTNVENQVEMYSDSVLVVGNNASDALTEIAELFAHLIRKALLLRGAMVKGRLTYQGNNQLRRICPTPDNNSFEYLYYWTDGIEFDEYARRIKDLKDVMVMYDKPTREHFEETIGVIQRAKHRHKTTNERLGVQ